MAGDYTYDPDDYLTSTMQSIHTYVGDKLSEVAALAEGVDVEMSFPNRDDWTKETPLQRGLVHFELDDDPAMILGFGVPTVIVDEGPPSDTVVTSEPQVHELNFDVGVWTSKEAGGVPKRAQIRKALFDLFGYPGQRRAFTEATDGLVIKSFGGGSDVLDRVNDLPIYRTTGITMIVSVFSRLSASNPADIIIAANQRQKLTIVGSDGNPEQLVTDESHWT